MANKTNINEPIAGLCGDFIISFLHREEDLGPRDGLNRTLFFMDLPENSFITIADQYIDLLKHEKPLYCSHLANATTTSSLKKIIYLIESQEPKVLSMSL